MEEQLIEIEEPIHTEQIQDIIGTPPKWLYRWGITIVMALALLCILISNLINYPEVVKTQLQIRSTRAPFSIVSNNSGSLIKILIPNNSPVKKGDTLAIMKSGVGLSVIQATITGELSYTGIIHENEDIESGHKLFQINADSTDFYGQMIISQRDVHKIKPGQKVLIRLRNTDEKQSGLTGTIKYVVSNPSNNIEYLAEMDFDNLKKNRHSIQSTLGNNTVADAEIILANTTLFQRLAQNLIKKVK